MKKKRQYNWKMQKFISIKIIADVYGPLAIHPKFNEEGWTITHLKTGYHFGPEIESWETAQVIAQELASEPVWDFVSINPTKKFNAAKKWAIEVFDKFGYSRKSTPSQAQSQLADNESQNK